MNLPTLRANWANMKVDALMGHCVFCSVAHKPSGLPRQAATIRHYAHGSNVYGPLIVGNPVGKRACYSVSAAGASRVAHEAFAEARHSPCLDHNYSSWVMSVYVLYR